METSGHVFFFFYKNVNYLVEKFSAKIGFNSVFRENGGLDKSSVPLYNCHYILSRKFGNIVDGNLISLSLSGSTE